MDVLVLVASFGVILAGSELFTNGIEWFGHKLELGEGAIGSVLAAIGTALPETMVLRMVRFRCQVPGGRTDKITVITSSHDIADADPAATFRSGPEVLQTSLPLTCRPSPKSPKETLKFHA